MFIECVSCNYIKNENSNENKIFSCPNFTGLNDKYFAFIYSDRLGT